MSGFNAYSGAGLGTAVLGSQYVASHVEHSPVAPAAKLMFAATGFAFGLYVLCAIALIVAGFFLRGAAAEGGECA